MHCLASIRAMNGERRKRKKFLAMPFFDMSEMTNAERASRAEAALLAYIDETGDSRSANGIDTWVSDLMSDLRHLADRVGFKFDPNAGYMNYEAELTEMRKGRWTRAEKWYVDGSSFTGPQEE